MFIATSAYSDKVSIPFDTYLKLMQVEFYERGYKLDLDGNNRTKESWGFIENRGNKFNIYTYKPITVEELEMIKEVTWEIKNG